MDLKHSVRLCLFIPILMIPSTDRLGIDWVIVFTRLRFRRAERYDAVRAQAAPRSLAFQKNYLIERRLFYLSSSSSTRRDIRINLVGLRARTLPLVPSRLLLSFVGFWPIDICDYVFFTEGRGKNE